MRWHDAPLSPLLLYESATYRFHIVSITPMSSRNTPSVTPSAEGDQSYFRGWTPHVWQSSRRGDQSPNISPESSYTVLSRRKVDRGNRPPLRPTRSRNSKYTGSSIDSPDTQTARAYCASSQAPNIARSSRDSITLVKIGAAAASSTVTSPTGWHRLPIPKASDKGVKERQPICSVERGSTNKFEISGHFSAYPNRRGRHSGENGSSEATDSTIRETKKIRRESNTNQDLATRNSEAIYPERSRMSPEARALPKRNIAKACRASQKHRDTKDKSTRTSLVSISQEANDRQSNLNKSRKKSLYARTKRALGLKDSPSPTSKRATLESATVTHSMTAQLLERASTLLKQATERNKGARLTDSSSTSYASNSSIAATHHRAGQYNYSSSSSFKIMHPDKSLPTTPESDSLYTGSDGNKYIRPDMSSPDAPKYLPSEARRVHTPPLPSDDARNMRLRGFFFDYNAPTEDGDAVIPRASKQPSKRLASDIDGIWFRVTPSEEDASELNTFATSIPDHFTSSPLCPRHPKHKSGGRGVCPAHG